MADDEAQGPEIQINIKGPSELKLQISISTSSSVSELKAAIAAKSDVEADRQRLIYSGRVLKDDDKLEVYKIQAGHTVHMVKGASRPAGSSSSSSSSAPPMQQLPTNISAGQNPADPLTQLNSSQLFGHPGLAGLNSGAQASSGGFNPFAAMGMPGVNPTDPNFMQTMMQDPAFLEQMGRMMSDPQVVEQMIAMNPQLAGMAPQVRETVNSEAFRNMVSNPDTFRQMLQMSNAFGGAGGANPMMSGIWGAPPAAFPAPGVPGQPNANPPAGATPGTQGAAGVQGTQNPWAANPWFNPAMMQHFAAGGGVPFGGGFGSPPTGTPAAAAAPTQPPEERFQTQLQQLQDMGFTNAAQNVRALLATGGNVHAAIEYILGGGGL